MKHKNFFIVPNQIFELGLKPKEFVVYCCLLRHSDKNTDNCFPSRRLIADECSMDKKTVDSALKELEARGLIKKVYRYRENGSRTSNMYSLASLLEQCRNSLWVASDIRTHNKIKESKRNTNRKERKYTVGVAAPARIFAHRKSSRGKSRGGKPPSPPITTAGNADCLGLFGDTHLPKKTSWCFNC